MKKLLRKIDSFLLPPDSVIGQMHFAPYIWLIYLLIFFVNLIAFHPIEHSYLYAFIGTVFFLIVYFNGYWASNQKIKWNILAILVIGSLLAQLTPGASVFFVYAAAFCCRLGSTKKAMGGVALILMWICIYSWLVDMHAFFYIPAIIFSLMIGGINIYQHDIDLKKQELFLSQQEVKHLAKISERERIARDLHDLIGHTFSVITLKAELAGKLIDNQQSKAKHEIKELEDISRDALKQIREVVTGYRTSDLNTELAHAKYILQSNDILFNYQQDEIEIKDIINKELAIILKEIVTNILKHAQASEVNCNVTKRVNDIILDVKDNGVGFKSKTNENCFGLKGIFERVEKLNGKISIDSEQGCHLTITVPSGHQND